MTPSRSVHCRAAAAGQLDDAEAILQRGLEVAPHIGALHGDYGAFLAKQQRFEEALEYFQRYVVLAGPANRLRSAFSRSLNLSFPRKEAMRRIMLRAASGPGGRADRPGKSGRAWSGGAVQPA